MAPAYLASIPALLRAALRARWNPAALFSSDIVAADKPILVRDFVRSALYDPNHGYFSKRSGPVGVLDSSIRFHKLDGRSAYMKHLDKLYKKHDIAWFTPMELFKPWYAYAIAASILRTANLLVPLKIYEIGGGSGTCAKCILDYMMLNAPPKVYNNMKYISVEISSSLAEKQLETVGEVQSHLSKFTVEHRDATDGAGWGHKDPQPCWVLMLEVLDNLPHDLVYSPDQVSPWMEVRIGKVNDRILEHGLKYPLALLSRPRLVHLQHQLHRSLCTAVPPPDESPHSPQPPAQPPSNPKLFVAGLSWSTDERSLMDAFSSFGAVTEDGADARCSTKQLRGHWPARYVVACSVAIYRNARSGLFGEAVRLFVCMMRAGTCPNSFTLVGALLAATGMGNAMLAQCIHVRAVKNGLDYNPFVGTALLNSYAKCGCPMKAYSLFSQMKDPGIVTWNSMISGLVHNDLFEEALLVFKMLLRSLGPIHNMVTMISIAQADAGCGDAGVCGSAHAYAVKTGLDLDVSVTNSILGMYLNFASLETGRDIFGKIAVNNVVTWTMMMGSLLQKGHAVEVIHMFAQMRSNGIVPDRVAMVSLVQACALTGDGRRGKLVHNQIVIRGFSRELPAVNSLITMYSKCEDLSSARTLFDGTRDKSLVSWTAMVAGYAENGNALEGLHLFAKIRHEGLFVIDSVTLVTLLLACCEIAKFDLCVQLHGYSYKSGLYLYRPVLNTLMAVYGKCGYVSIAHKVFDEMICHNTVSWNTLILSYGINGQGKEAISLFNEMEKYSEDRDSVTYLNTLLACSHSGLVDDGLVIFRRMINEEGINPCQEHIGCIVDMLARAGRLDEAAGVASLTDNKMGPNAWKALLGGGHLHSNMKFTEVAAEKVLTMESFDYGHVLLLSNTYASLGKYSTAESVRSTYIKQIVKTTLGLSSIYAIPSSP